MLANKISDWVVFDFHDRIHLHFLPLSFHISIVAPRSCCRHGLPGCSGPLIASRPTNLHGGSPTICLCPGAFAIPRPTNSHGGSPTNMSLSCRTEHRPILQRALLPRFRSCLLLLGVASHPPLPVWALQGGAAGPGAPPSIDVFLPRALHVRSSNALFSYAAGHEVSPRNISA